MTNPFEKPKAKTVQETSPEVNPVEENLEELSLEEEGYLVNHDPSKVPEGYVSVYNPHLDRWATITKERLQEIENIKSNREERNKLSREDIPRPEMSPGDKKQKEHEEEMRQRGFTSKYDPFMDESTWELVDAEANERWISEHAELLREREEASARELAGDLAKENARKERREAETALESQKLQEKEAEAKQKRDDRIARKAAEAGVSPEEYQAKRREEDQREIEKVKGRLGMNS